ncbi:MAG: hypothetical protein ABSF46_17395 [Terriglobia bacterium]|jgi:hypothetical protein
MNERSRREYSRAIYSRYRQAELREKQVILNEFCRNTGGYPRRFWLGRGMKWSPPADVKIY